MALVGDITGIGAAAEGASGIVTGLTGLIEKFIPDKEQAAAAAAAIQAELLKQKGQENSGQIEINKAEAGNSNIWVSGWRPGIGWVCMGASAWSYILAPIIQYIAALNHSTVQLPHLNSEELTALTTGMLGLGAMHSFDKYNGTTPPTGDVVTSKQTIVSGKKK